MCAIATTLLLVALAGMGGVLYKLWVFGLQLQAQLDMLVAEVTGLAVPATLMTTPSYTKQGDQDEEVAEVGSYEGPKGWR
jgi:hypothetical protein